MEATVLGSGTSTGIPVIGCDCRVCQSNDSKDRRKRASILIRDIQKSITILIDTGPDLRTQMLLNKVQKLSGILYTHYHYDHLGGLNDLRAFTLYNDEPLKCWCNEQTYRVIKKQYPYVFKKSIPGQLNLDLQLYKNNKEGSYEKLFIGDIEIKPIRLMHVPKEKIECVGFVFNNKFGYLTDFKQIFEYEEEFLYDLDVLFLGAPLYKRHPTHISIPEAFSFFEKFKPKVGVIGHLSHMERHSDMEKKFPTGVIPAYDGQTFTFK